MPETRRKASKINTTMEEEGGNNNNNNNHELETSTVAEVSPGSTAMPNSNATMADGDDALKEVDDSQPKRATKPAVTKKKTGGKKKKSAKAGEPADKVGKVAKSSKVAKMPKAGKAPTMRKTSKSDGVARKAGTKKGSTKKKGASPPKQVVSVKAKPTMKSANKAAKSLKAGGFSKKTIPMKPVQVKKQENLVNMTVAACGVAFFTFVKSSNKLMMAYMAAFFDAIQNNTALQAELKSMGLFEIRVDSTSNDTKKFTVGNNEIPELQLGCIVGRDATPKALQSQWNKVVAIADKHTSTVGTKNKYATRTHLGENLTPRSGPVPLDVLFPDEDTVNVMQVAYPDNDLEDIAGDPEILSQYYTNPKHSRNVVKSHIAGIPLVYHDEEEEDSEEEDSDDEESTDGEEEDVDDDEDEEEEEDEDDEEDDNGVDEEESEDSEEEDDMEVNSEDDGDGSVEDGNNGDSGASANPLIAAVVY